MRLVHFKKFTKSILLVIAFIIGVSQIVWASDLEVDNQAPSSQQPNIEVEEQSGVPIINITEPTPSGVSHNVFKEYNVGEEGVVFNNNANQGPEWKSDNFSVLTKGPLFINDHLNGRAAEIILAEVSGDNISNLLGATEIYGRGADFVLANPNGIYCNGASFINTHRVTLTTGRPILTYEGAIRALQVDRGTIEIHAGGLTIPVDHRGASPLEILSRAVKISGKLKNPDAVYIYTGKNEFDYANKTLKAQKSTENTSKGYLAIDGALVGKIGARKITIIATEQGVGANCPPMIAEAANIEITADGNIQLKNVKTVGDLLVTSQNGSIKQEAEKNIAQKGCQLQAKQGKISLATQQFQVNETTNFSSKELDLGPQTQLWVGKDASEPVSLNLFIEEKIDNRGAMYIPQLLVSPLANFTNRGKIITQQDLNITSQTIDNQGVINGNQSVHIQAGQLENSGNICGEEAIQIKETQSVVNRGTLKTPGNLGLAISKLHNEGTIASEKGEIELAVTDQLVNKSLIVGETQVIINTGGKVDNQANVISKKGSLKLTAKELVNTGRLYGHVGQTLHIQESLQNKQTINTQGSLHIAASQVANEGILSGRQQLTIQSQTLDNAKEINSLGGDAHLVIQQKLVNRKDASVIVEKGLLLEADKMINRGGVSANRTMEAKVQGKLKNAGVLKAKQTLTINANELDNIQEIHTTTGDTKLHIDQRFTNQQGSQITSAKCIELHAGEVANCGSIKAQEKLDLAINELANKGTIEGARCEAKPFQKICNEGEFKVQADLALTTDELRNAGMLKSTAGSLDLTVYETLTNQKDLYSKQDLTLKVDNKLLNTGTIYADGSQHITANSLENSAVMIAKGGNSTVRITHQVTNRGAMKSYGAQTIEAESLMNQGEIVSTTNEVTLNMREKLDNEGRVYTSNRLVVTADELINKHKMVTMGGGEVEVRQSMNNLGVVKAQNALHISAQQLTNIGTMTSIAGSLILNMTGRLTNQGGIESAKVLTIRTSHLDNKTTGKIITNQHLKLQEAREVTNAGGIHAGSLSQTRVPIITNSGTISIVADTELITQNFYNSGILRVTAGKLTLDTEDDLEKAQKISTQAGDMNLTGMQKLTNQKDARVVSVVAPIFYGASLENRGQVYSQGPITIKTDQQVLNIGSLHTNGQLELESGTTIDNQGFISAQEDAQIIAKEKLTNAATATLRSNQNIQIKSQTDTIENQGAITATGNTKLQARGDIIQSGILSSGEELDVITDNKLHNTGTIQPTNKLHIQAQHVNNRGSIEAKSATMNFHATQKIINSCQIINETGDISFEAQELENQPGGTVSSGSRILIDARQVTNQKESTLSASTQLELVNIDKLTNTGNIQAFTLSHTGNPEVANEGKIELQDNLTLKSQSFTNSGDVVLVRGDLDITSQTNLTISQGSMVTQQGNLRLAANTGNLCNTRGRLSSHQDLTLVAQGSIENGQLMKSGNNLTMQGRSLTNSGNIIAESGNILIQKLSGELHNTDKIQSGGQLEIETAACVNEGQLRSGSKLTLKASTLNNRNAGQLQAQTAEIKVTGQLTNTKNINTERELTLEAGRLHNAGKIGANGKLVVTVKEGNLDNAGTLASEAGNALIRIEKGGLTNTNQLKSKNNLTIDIVQTLKNTSQLITEQQLKISARSLDNTGRVVGRGGVTVNTAGDLINADTLGTGKDLILTVGGQLRNVDKGHILQVRGKLELSARSLHNTAKMNFLPTNQQDSIQIRDFVYNAGSIVSRGDLKFEVTNYIENRGVIGVEQNLALKAPIIKHLSGQIQSNQGNLDLTAATRLTNASILNVRQGTLAIKTDHLDNQTDINIDKNLRLNIQNLDNSRGIYAKGNFELNLQTLTNRRGGVVAGGEGKSRLVVASKLDNDGKIFTRGSLYIQATKVKVVNKGELVASESLKLRARDLLNEQLVQGGGTTSLKIARSITNNATLASTKHLVIKAETITVGDNIRSTPVIQANQNLSLQVSNLRGNDIKGGGDTRIEIDYLYMNENYNLISSEGNLHIITGGSLTNKEQQKIVAGHNLTLEAEYIINEAGACIQGGNGITRLKVNSFITNWSRLSSSGDLILEYGGEYWRAGISNRGTIQSGKGLYIRTNEFYNDKAVFSKGDMLIQVSSINNDQGNIFTEGNIVLEGKEEGAYAGKVSNITGDHEARIEAMKDITIRAKELENMGKVVSEGSFRRTNVRYGTAWRADSSWDLIKTTHGNEANGYCYDEKDSRDGILYVDGERCQFEKSERELEFSGIQTRSAHINARKNLLLYITDRIDNHDSQLIAKDTIQIGSQTYVDNVPTNERIAEGPYVTNQTYCRSEYLDDACIYEKTWAIFKRCKRKDKLKRHECIRKFREGKYFSAYAPQGSTIRAGSDLELNAQKFTNGISVESVHVAPVKDPLKKLAESQTFSALPAAGDLPQGDYGLYKLQLDPNEPDPATQSIPTSRVQVSEIKLPSADTPPMPDIDTNMDILLAETLIPQEPEFDDMRKAAAVARSHTTLDEEEGLEDLPSYTPSYTPASHPTRGFNIGQATDPGQPNYDLPTDKDRFTGQRDTTTDTAYKPAPPQEKIKVKFLHPLYRSRVPVDQAQYYGSPYFLRHVGLDPGGRGTPNKPFRFLGDPFFESRIINDAIYKQTGRSFLYDNVATPEEQVKCLIDNTAAVSKDLQVGLGVALSKEQINGLKKDILWYVEEEVHGQQVLVPQIYLTKTTIDNLRSGKGAGVYSRGDMHLHVAGALTNTGNIGAGGDQTIRAESLRNESFGNTQATIGAGGVVDVQTKKNIDNISGAISGQKGTKVVSKEGQILNQTKLLNDSTLHMQASIESAEGNVMLEAKQDIVHQAAKVRAGKNVSMNSKEGDVHFFTQQLKQTHSTHTSSQEDGFWNSKSSSHTTTKTTTEHAACAIEAGENLAVSGRDITFMGAQVKAGKEAHMRASRDFKALAVQDTEETSTHTESYIEKRDLFGSQSNSTSSSTYHKQVTSKGCNFDIGDKFKVEAGGNADFEGATVDAGDVDMNVQGETTIRKAYNEETSESSSSTENKNEALFGLIKDNKGEASTRRKYDKTGVGNNWKVRNTFQVKGKKDVVTQGMDLTAHQIHIESTEGNTYDRAVEEIHEDYEAKDSYRLRQGIIDSNAFKAQGNQGRVAWKLREKQEEKRVVKDKHQTAQGSSFKTVERVVTAADGTKQTIAGNATFKAEKKVVLEATETDIEGKLSLQGKEGVDIIEKKETTQHEEKSETYTEELSLGVKNSLIAAGYQAIEVKDAIKRVAEAKKAYDAYRSQLRQARKLQEIGDITQEEYEEVAAEGKYHLAAISAASLDVVAKSKQLLSSASQAIKTAGSTGGFSIDLQADINKVADEVISYAESAKGSNIKTKQLEVVTQGDFKVRGSEIQSEETSIEAKEVVVEAFKGKNNNKKKGYSAGGNVTVDLAPQPGMDLSLHGDITRGHDEGVQHTNSVLNLGEATLNIKRNMTIQGAQVKTTSLGGEIGGKVRVETLQDTSKGSQYTMGGSVGAGTNPGANRLSIGLNGNRSQHDATWADELSSLTSTGAMNLKVKGKTELVGAHLGSDSGQLHLETEKVKTKDLDGHKKGSNWGGGVGATRTKAPGAEKAKYEFNANLQYSRNRAKQKLKASLSQGNVVETGSVHTKLHRRATQQGPTNYLDTQSELKVDSKMAELIVNPVKAAKEVVEDGKVVGHTASFVAETIGKVGEFGVGGTVEALRLGLAATGATIDLVKEENETQQLGSATDADKFQKALHEAGAKLQARMGVENPAEVKLYQGESDSLKNTEFSNHNASFDAKRNTTNYNTSRAGFNKIETIADDLAHESTHKSISENKSSRQFINATQEEKLAQHIGNHARKLANSFKDKSKTQPVMNSAEWNIRNKDSEILKNNNPRLAKIDGNGVKASPQAEMYLEWKKLSTEEQDKAARTFFSFVPIVGSALGLYEGIKEGDKVKGAVNLGFLGLDLLSVGAASSMAKGGAKILAKKGAQEAVKQIEKQVVKEGVELFEKAAAKGVQQGIMKGGEVVGGTAAKVEASAFKHGYKYTSRIRARSLQDPVAHNFPYSFDDIILKAKPVTQCDGSLLFRYGGILNGTNGFFEIGLNPATKSIFHRTFVRGK